VHIDENKLNNAVSNLRYMKVCDKKHSFTKHKGVAYEFLTELPAEYKEFKRYQKWTFKNYFSDGVNMLLKISDTKYRKLYVNQNKQK
jgi:hypothetical protein